MNTKIVPNLLSGLRIALMPALVTTAISGLRSWFIGLLVVSLTTDALDGFLARRLNAYSDLGRKLDSAADYLTMICGLSGIALLWPEIVHRELPWIIIGLTAFFAVIVYGFVRLGRAPCYHTWASKVLAVFTATSLIPLLGGYTAVPFHVAIALQIFVAAEEMAIALMIPWHVGEMATVWHANKLRRRQPGGEAPTNPS